MWGLDLGLHSSRLQVHRSSGQSLVFFVLFLLNLLVGYFAQHTIKLLHTLPFVVGSFPPGLSGDDNFAGSLFAISISLHPLVQQLGHVVVDGSDRGDDGDFWVRSIYSVKNGSEQVMSLKQESLLLSFSFPCFFFSIKETELNTLTCFVERSKSKMAPSWNQGCLAMSWLL